VGRGGFSVLRHDLHFPREAVTCAQLGQPPFSSPEPWQKTKAVPAEALSCADPVEFLLILAMLTCTPCRCTGCVRVVVSSWELYGLTLNTLLALSCLPICPAVAASMTARGRPRFLVWCTPSLSVGGLSSVSNQPAITVGKSNFGDQLCRLDRGVHVFKCLCFLLLQVGKGLQQCRNLQGSTGPSMRIQGLQ
jgi:hypothetical protein